jgi:hypothetical protein
MNNNLTVGLIVVVALLGGFYGGFRYESGKIPTASAASATPPAGTARTGTGAAGGGFAGGGGGGGGFAGRGNAGTVTGLTSTGFTLHNAATGTDTKVTFGPTVTVRKTVTGQIGDVANSATVQVTGTRDSSGNLVATAITLVPLPTASPSAGG